MSKAHQHAVQNGDPILYTYLTADPAVTTIQDWISKLKGITLKGKDLLAMTQDTSSIYSNVLQQVLRFFEGTKYQTYHDTSEHQYLTIGVGFNLDQFEPDYTIVKLILTSIGIDPDTVLVADPSPKPTYPDGWLDGQPPKPAPSKPYPFNDTYVNALLQISLVGYQDKFVGKAQTLYQLLSDADLLDVSFSAAELIALQSLAFDNLVGPHLCTAISTWKQSPTPENELAIAVQFEGCTNKNKDVWQQNRVSRSMGLFFEDVTIVAVPAYQANQIYAPTVIPDPKVRPLQLLPIVDFDKTYLGGKTVTTVPGCAGATNDESDQTIILGSTGDDVVTITRNSINILGLGNDLCVAPQSDPQTAYCNGGPGFDTYQALEGSRTYLYISDTDEIGVIKLYDTELTGIFWEECSNGSNNERSNFDNAFFCYQHPSIPLPSYTLEVTLADGDTQSAMYVYI